MAEQSFLRCKNIAANSNANFFHAAKLLPIYRQNFFFATYAAMRIMDDLVDEVFLTRVKEDRDLKRAGMRVKLKQWLVQTTKLENNDGPLDPDIILALSNTLGRSDMGVWHWQALGTSLKSDIEETEIRTWNDFLDYCHGATVAPASIFIYLLASSYTLNDGYKYGLSKPPEFYAKDLAIYCYIVHILRDLAKDAGASPRLITIPLDIFKNIGLDRTVLSDAIEQKSIMIEELTKVLIKRALPYRNSGHKMLKEICCNLGEIESIALNRLISIYDFLFDAASKKNSKITVSGPDLEKEFRHDLFISPVVK